MTNNVLLFLVLFAASMSTVWAGEGITLISSDSVGDRTSTTEMNIEHDKVALKPTGRGRKMTFVYLATENLMRMIDHGRQTYREMTKQDVQAMASQVNDGLPNTQADGSSHGGHGPEAKGNR